MAVHQTPRARFEVLLASGTLSRQAQATAEQLLDHISKPVRIGLFGRPQCGKTQLLQVLAGQCLIPEGVQLPTLELTHAPQPRCAVVLQDATRLTLPGADLVEAAKLQPAFVSLGLPLEALKNFSLLEVVSDGTPGDMQAAVAWAAGRTDMAIWCTQDFGPDEQASWASFPDNLRDHGYLVLTKADALSASGSLADRLEALRGAFADEFRAVLPVAAAQALDAAGADGTISETGMNASGGTALTRALRRQIAIGRQADMDNVLLFLKRHEPAEPDMPLTAPPAAENAAAPRRSAQEILSQALSAAAEQPEPAVAADRAAEDGPLLTEATAPAALAYLRSRARDLAELAAGTDGPDAREISMHCLTTASQISDIFMDGEPSPALNEAIEDAHEAAEVITLLQMEGNEGAAVDAVTLILQIQRGFEDAAAA